MKLFGIHLYLNLGAVEVGGNTLGSKHPDSPARGIRRGSRSASSGQRAEGAHQYLFRRETVASEASMVGSLLSSAIMRRA
jgi:hypothetical protein